MADAATSRPTEALLSSPDHPMGPTSPLHLHPLSSWITGEASGRRNVKHANAEISGDFRRPSPQSPSNLYQDTSLHFT